MATCSKCYSPKAQCCCPVEPGEPILPRCQDVNLADGNFTNATVVVAGGCITQVSSGLPLQYSPQICCGGGGGGGGGGGSGLPGPPGAPGTPATVTVGTVTTTAPGSLATVTNIGSAQNAILDFTIPQGQPGTTPVLPGGVTFTDTLLTVNNGIVQGQGINWPPVTTAIDGGTSSAGISILLSKSPIGTLSVGVDATVLVSSLQADYGGQSAALQAQINTILTRLTSATLFRLDLLSAVATTVLGSASKTVVGARYLNPANIDYGLSPTSTAVLYAILRTSDATSSAGIELYQATGTGSPQIIAATPTTVSLTPVLVQVDVSAAFVNTAPSAIFEARLWTGSPDGTKEAICEGAWIEIKP